MLFAAGLLLLALGLFSGAILLLAPLGLIEASAGLTLWIFFPAFTIGGYLLAASAAPDTSLPVLSRVTGALLLVLALIAGVVLVLQGGSILESHAGSISLWYVLAIGLVGGASGLAAHRKPQQPA
jgi:hypothetical protein